MALELGAEWLPSSGKLICPLWCAGKLTKRSAFQPLLVPPRCSALRPPLNLARNMNERLQEVTGEIQMLSRFWDVPTYRDEVLDTLKPPGTGRREREFQSLEYQDSGNPYPV